MNAMPTVCQSYISNKITEVQKDRQLQQFNGLTSGSSKVIIALDIPRLASMNRI